MPPQHQAPGAGVDGAQVHDGPGQGEAGAEIVDVGHLGPERLAHQGFGVVRIRQGLGGEVVGVHDEPEGQHRVKRGFDRRRGLASVDHGRPHEGDQLLVGQALLLPQEAPAPRAAVPVNPARPMLREIGSAALDPQDRDRPAGEVGLAAS